MKCNRMLACQATARLIVLAATLLLLTGAAAATNLKTLHVFELGNGGNSPPAGLIFDQAGNLYGTTGAGGTYNQGVVFELTPKADGGWTERVLYNFCSVTNCADGGRPAAGLIFDSTGNIYGTAVEGGSGFSGVVFELTPNAHGSWSETVLYSFCSVTNCADGWFPLAGLIFDTKGNLYGTTELGGKGATCYSSCGTVFELTPHSNGSWTEKVLHSFCAGQSCRLDGQFLRSGLTFDGAGNLYGTTQSGGASYGGTVFKLTPKTNGSWTEKILYSFAGGDDGAEPLASVIFDQAGNLYGTTGAGGDPSYCERQGCGAVFKLAPNQDGSWNESVIHRFTTPDGGRSPFANLTFDIAGNLYGTTEYGGDSSCHCGVVFKLAPNSNGGWSETVLLSFDDDPGARPVAGVIFDAAGNLYGTTYGEKSAKGSVFEITP